MENAIDALARVISKTTWDNIECVGVSVRDVDCPPFIFYRCAGLEKLLRDVHLDKGEKVPSFAADFRKLSSKESAVEEEEIVAEPVKAVPPVKESKPKSSKQEPTPSPKVFKVPTAPVSKDKKVSKEKKSARK